MHPLARITTVPVELRPLSLSLSATFPLARVAGENVRLRLRHGRQASYGFVMEIISDDFVVPFATNLVFSSLQPGRYQLEVRIPGAAFWQSEHINHGGNGAQVTARLESGADLKYQVNPPGGPSLSVRPTVEVLQNGKLLPSHIYADWFTNAYRSLVPGHYTLRVLSRAEQTRKSYGTDALIPAAYNYRGAERSFTISENSPNTIDLGTIELQAGP